MRRSLFWGLLVVLAVFGSVHCEVDKAESISTDSDRQLRGKDGLDPQLQKLFGQGNRNEEGETGAEPLRNKGGKKKNKLGRKPDASAEPSENGYKPEGSAGGLKGGKKRKGGKRKGNKGGAEGAADAEEEGEERRMLQTENEFPDEADRSEEAEARRQELRAKKHEEIHARYKERRQNEEKSREEAAKPARKAPRERESPSGRRDSVEDYMAQRHKEMRERHTRDRGRDRSNPSGRRERHKRPESDGRHAVLRRRVVKHEHLFTPEELAEIHEDLNDHKVDEDRLDAARDKLNSEFDALREIDDRDERLEQLEVLKGKRAATRDADRLARDALRERFQTIRDKLEAKLKTELRM